MKEVEITTPLFKSYLQPSNLYTGGKTRGEVDSGGKRIYKMSSNENLLGSSPKALAAIQQHFETLHEYPDRSDKRLQTALANFYRPHLEAAQFITANGGTELLDLICRAFLSEGVEYIVTNPMFKPYQMLSERMGAKIIDIPLEAPNFTLNLAGILAAINENTRLIFLTSPNNPTGTYIPKVQLDYLIGQLPDHVVLVLDEVYYQFVEATDYTTALPYVKAGKQVIGLNSFSKTYGLAGLRLGYAYSTPQIAEYIQRLVRPFHLNSLSMEAGIAALSDTDFLTKTINLVQQERTFLYQQFDLMGIQYWRSQANFILFKPKKEAKLLAEQLQKEGIMIRPAVKFGAPGCLRVTVGSPEANQAFIIALEKCL